MILRGKKFVLIGGAGLIGSHTAEELIKEDIKELVIFDNFFRGSMENVKDLLKDDRVKIFEAGGDITQIDLLDSVLKNTDGVFHFAALWLLQCHMYPRAAFKVNVEGMFNVLEACVKNNIERLVWSSSASVYGDAEKEPMTEKHPFKNKNFYGSTKIAGEAMATAFSNRYNLKQVGLRYMNVYGPRQDYHGAYIAVMMKMLDAIDNNKSPKIMGDGTEAFDFVYVKDCAVANICAMIAETSDEYYNVGTGIKTTLKELAEKLLKLSNSNLKVEYEDRSEATLVKSRVGCTVKAEKELKFTAKTSLHDGLKDLIKWRKIDKQMKNEKKKIEISRPLTGIEEWEETKESILSGWLTQGPKVRKFEEMFSQYHQAKYSLATTSCTTALHLALLANNIGKGDEVIVPAFTWVSTANVVLYCGAKLVLADVDKKTFNICISDVLSKITSKTKAVIPVHLFGLCVDIDKLKKGLPKTVKIIEDAACAAGAIYKKKFAGTLGDAAAFSFHPRKSITTGEGGMLTSNNKKFIIKAEKLRNHGAEISEEQRHNGPKPYLLPDFNFLGYNYRMTDIQGSVGIAQIKKLNRIIKERSKWASFYRRELSKIEWILCPSEPKVGRHSWQAFVIYINPETSPRKRNEIMDFLENKGISTRPGTHAIHTLNYYAKKFNFKPKNFPNAFDCQNNTIALPLHNFMNKSDYEYIVKCIKEIK